jgi:hypothetical protein
MYHIKLNRHIEQMSREVMICRLSIRITATASISLSIQFHFPINLLYVDSPYMCWHVKHYCMLLCINVNICWYWFICLLFCLTYPYSGLTPKRLAFPNQVTNDVYISFSRNHLKL